MDRDGSLTLSDQGQLEARPLTKTECRAARRLVETRARDEADLRLLLAALGLTDAPPPGSTP
ncbi:hypothetical protein C9F11_46790 (plasmid) [Streptomyces sp. YIM 121038]|nr:hypothetical protein C9F11_46790 [Streptomyces sp. YIM 121038]